MSNTNVTIPTLNLANPSLGAFLTATASAIGAGFVAFGHPDLSAPASTAFISGAALVIAVLHNGILKAHTASKAATSA